MSNLLENLTPTYQKTLRHLNKQIREQDEIDSNAVKALADLTRAYLQLKKERDDPQWEGNADYYDQMVREAEARASEALKEMQNRNQTKKRLVKRKSLTNQ